MCARLVLAVVLMMKWDSRSNQMERTDAIRRKYKRISYKMPGTRPR